MEDSINIVDQNTNLNQLFAIPADTKNFNELCDSIIKCTTRIDFLDHYFLHLVEDSGKKTIRYCNSYESGLEEEKVPKFKGLEEITWKIVNTKSAFCFKDTSQIHLSVGIKAKNEYGRSLISMPVSTGDRVIAVIHFLSSPGNVFTKEQMNYLLFAGAIISSVMLRSGVVEDVKIDKSVLEESVRKSRIILEREFDLIIEVSMDGTFLYANDQHEKILGYSSDVLTGSNIFKYIHPEDVSSVIRAFSHGMGTLTTEYVKFRYRNINGNWIWLESIGTPYRVTNGEARAMVASRAVDVVNQ